MEEQKRKWNFVTYGTSVDTRHNGYSGSIEEENLSLWCLRGKGKLVPASTDGLAFYYTVIDPEQENFTLCADVLVESWTFSNGQDGFGLMACDSIGENGDEKSFWNNSYMAAVTRNVYCYDREKNKVSDGGDRYVMNLGVCAIEKKGVTPDLLACGQPLKGFVSRSYPLETAAARRGLPPGTYNLVGGYTNEDGVLNDMEQLTAFHLEIKRDNNGYRLSYRDAQGTETAKVFYREDGTDELTRLDNGRIYVGFFAARNAKIAVRKVELTTISPKEDAKPCPPPISYISPDFRVLSADVANRKEYRLLCCSSGDGLLDVWDEQSKEALAGKVEVKAKVKCSVTISLKEGQNCFDLCFTPDPEYKPSAYERFDSCEPRHISFSVHCHTETGGAKTVYVGPCGAPEGAGTRLEPLDIYSAVRQALPGQKLFLLGGRYPLDAPLLIPLGMDGEPGNPIVLQAAPGEKERPVLDFGGRAEGMAVRGHHWQFKGFDVTRSKNGANGIRLCGSFHLVEDVRVYENGNTGLQISRYQELDSREEWPCCNHILNCTSYLNADGGYTDSDGFAAKITTGPGNVFEGCISAYNADDGFDLFAKVETGPIGAVTIKNCIAFKNGYVLDKNGRERHVGLGNGFKLGGSSLAGGHVLKDCIAFANGEKGIDSNSCPDVKIENSIAYNNESHNVALFTTDASDTDFYARNILSFKDNNTVPDKLEGRGSQRPEKIFGASNFYFDGEKSVNAQGETAQTSGFASLDVEKAIHGGIRRNEDGSIDRGGFLERRDG